MDSTDQTRIPQKWDRFKFLTEQGVNYNAQAQQLVQGLTTGSGLPQPGEEEPVYASGIIVDTEIIEGQLMLYVLIENAAEDIKELLAANQQTVNDEEDEEKVEGDPNNPFGIKEFWEYEAWEYLGKTSLEDMILSPNEKIRNFALARQEEIERELEPSNEEYAAHQKRSELKKRILEADDEQLDELIDLL